AAAHFAQARLGGARDGGGGERERVGGFAGGACQRARGVARSRRERVDRAGGRRPERIDCAGRRLRQRRLRAIAGGAHRGGGFARGGLKGARGVGRRRGQRA